MLASNKMIGFVICSDAKRARRFYEETLGFQFVSEDEFALVMKTDENYIRISTVQDAIPAQHTILGWEVKQIDQVTRFLKARGVSFETYPWMKPQQDDLGIWASPSGAKVAWFKDPDGNVLSISEH